MFGGKNTFLLTWIQSSQSFTSLHQLLQFHYNFSQKKKEYLQKLNKIQLQFVGVPIDIFRLIFHPNTWKKCVFCNIRLHWHIWNTTTWEVKTIWEVFWNACVSITSFFFYYNTKYLHNSRCNRNTASDIQRFQSRGGVCLCDVLAQ